MTDMLDLVARVSLLLSIGLVLTLLLRRQSAALRHWVLASTVTAALMLPLAGLVAPAWQGHWPVPTGSANTAAPTVAPDDRGGGVSSTTTVETFAVAEGTSTAGTRRISPAVAIATVWTTGTAAGALFLLMGLWRLRRVRAGAREDGGVWQDEARIIGERLGLRHPVRVLHGSHQALLIAWGWRTPTILLPAGAKAWHEDRRRVVLAHELAHLARGDWAAQLAAEALRALYWFNPLTWITCRWLRLESECACDDHVLAEGISAPDYATHLLDIARILHAHRHPALPAPAMARQSSLEGRVRAMLNHTRNRRPVHLSIKAAVAAASAFVTLAVAGAQPAVAPVTGTIVDSSGRVLPDVRVSLADRASQSRFEVRTDATGRYAFAAIPLAEYTLEARLPGFKPADQPVHVTGVATHDIRMEVGTLEETVTVRRDTVVDPSELAARRAELEARRVQARLQFDEVTTRTTARCQARGPSTIGGNILAPRKLLHVNAVYPDTLRDSGTGGSVTLGALIGTDGTVRDVTNVKGPHPDLEAAAADAVRQWQFSTTFLNCEPIEVQMTVTTNFVAQ